QAFSLSLQLKGLPLDMFSPLLPMSIQGSVSGTAAISGTGSNPELHVKLTSDQLASALLSQIPPLHAAWTLDLKDQQLSLQGRLLGLGQRTIEIAAQLPVQLAFDDLSGAGLRRELPMHAEIKAGGEISSILETLMPGVVHFTGNTNL